MVRIAGFRKVVVRCRILLCAAVVIAAGAAVHFCWPETAGSQPAPGEAMLLSSDHLETPVNSDNVNLTESRVRRRVPWCGHTRLLSPVTAQEFQFLSSHRSNRDLLVYSAFYDPRLAPRKPIIRSTGIARNVGMSGLMCQLWYRRWSQVMVTMQAHVERLPEGDSRRYQAVLITCSTSSKVEEIPSAVSFAWSHCAQPAGFLPVRVLPSTPVRNGQFAVCMSPLHSFYDNVDEAVQTLELNRLFGANRFFVYNFASSKRVASLLASKHYAKDVTVLPFQPPVNIDRWPQPSNNTVEVKHFAQMAMLQDCVMRASAKYEFAVFTDMNEVVVPRSEGLSNWRDLVRERMSDNKAAGLSLQHADFWLEWPADSEMSANATISGLKLSALLKLHHDEVRLHGTPSKMIVKPHFVQLMGVQLMWRYTKGWGTEYVNFRLAGVHRYRSWKDLGPQDSDQVRDPTLLRYMEQLVANVLRARTALGLPLPIHISD